MPRVRADDYDDKMRSIMDAAAALFADTGYPSVKMQDIAKACDASKSMLYHYFETKDDLLFAILEEHLERVVSNTDEIREKSDDPQERLAAFIKSFVRMSAKGRRRHLVAVNDLKFLPEVKQAPLLDLERKIVRLAAEFLRELKPGLEEHLYKPFAMMLIGLLNWSEIWYRPGGSITPDQLCEYFTHLFLNGFLATNVTARQPTETPPQVTR